MKKIVLLVIYMSTSSGCSTLSKPQKNSEVSTKIELCNYDVNFSVMSKKEKEDFNNNCR